MDEPTRISVLPESGEHQPVAFAPARVRNVSESGVFVQTDLAIRVGQRL